LNDTRRRIARQYRERLSGTPIGLPQEHGRGAHVYHQFTIRSERREQIRQALAGEGIASAVFYVLPLHRQPAYAAAYRDVSLPVCERLAGTVLSLPMHPFLDEAAVDRVCEIVRKHA
jgi:dTDP-4-amino-4,6-dideoxygalactose transaminase